MMQRQDDKVSLVDVMRAYTQSPENLETALQEVCESRLLTDKESAALRAAGERTIRSLRSDK